MAGGTVTLAMVGDISIQREDPASIFTLGAEPLQKADIAFGNLEGPITNVGAPPEVKSMNRLQVVSDERMVEGLTYAGFDVLSLANNHSLNMGTEGMLRCVEVLDRAGIAHAGAGKNATEARRPAIIERNGTKVAFLAYTSVFWPPFAATDQRPGMATVRGITSYEPEARLMEVPGSAPIIHTFADPKDKASMQDDVRSAKAQADIVVVSWHWGLSGATGGGYGAGQIIAYQVELAHAAIDAGADLIVGHHPHQLEGIEVYNDRPIFYSLGNFALEFHSGKKRQTTAVATVTIRDGRIEEAGFIPYIINEHAQPLPAGPEDAKDVLDELVRKSKEFATEFHPSTGDVLILGSKVPVGVR